MTYAKSRIDFNHIINTFINVETRYIEISLDTAKRWYEQGGELKDMALGVYTLEELGYSLPKTFEEYLAILDQWRIIPHKEEYEDFNPKIAAVKKLILLRDFYNNHWKPDWKEMVEDKFSIIKNYIKETDEYKYDVEGKYSPTYSTWLVFKSKKLADEFLNNFRELIEEAGDLI